tara:strand:- start:59 stop:1027 length:969 start_codon:yes stop_codon:yes gene_type:complete
MNTNPFSAPKVQYDRKTGRWTSDIPTEGGIDPKKGELLSFGNGNSKLKALRKAAAAKLKIPAARVRILTLTLPAGWSCPGANECLAFADPTTGKVWDSPELKFRCFEASAERYENVRQQNWHNFNLLRRLTGSIAEYSIAGLILDSLKEATKKFKDDDVVIVRIHVGGDFYSKSYLEGWAIALRAIQLKPSYKSLRRLKKVIGYAYTKSLHHLAKLSGKPVNGIPAPSEQVSLPENFVLTASEGGKFDHLIQSLKGLKFAKVVFSPEQAQSEGLEIDHDDSHAVFGKESFGLLIHGTQPKGSQSAKALSSLKARGVDSGYSN